MIRNNKAQPAYSSKTGSAEQVWIDKACDSLAQGSSYTNDNLLRQMNPNNTETAIGENYNPTETTRHPGCPAPRKIIADTGAAVDLIGARDIHAHDRQTKTAEPIHFCTANGNTKADTIVQYYSPTLEEEVSPHVLTDSVSAFSIGKRIATGSEFHWIPKRGNKEGSCTLIKPDGKEIHFEVDEHDVPYFMENRTTAVPASIDNKNPPVAAPAVESIPAEPAQSDSKLTEDRARRDARLRSILKAADTVEPPEPRRSLEQPPEPIETDYSEVDAEEDQDLRRRGDKAFLTKEAMSLTHLCTHLPKNPYCTSCL
jgi:hypothetical protein